MKQQNVSFFSWSQKLFNSVYIFDAVFLSWNNCGLSSMQISATLVILLVLLASILARTTHQPLIGTFLLFRVNKSYGTVTKYPMEDMQICPPLSSLFTLNRGLVFCRQNRLIKTFHEKKLGNNAINFERAWRQICIISAINYLCQGKSKIKRPSEHTISIILRFYH